MKVKKLRSNKMYRKGFRKTKVKKRFGVITYKSRPV